MVFDVQIPYGLGESLIKSLASAALAEIGRIYGVKKELERLKMTVESIRAVLLDAEEKRERSRAVENWIRRLKDVLNQADDILDEMFVKDMRHKADGVYKNKAKEVFRSLSPKEIAFRHKIAHKIENVRKTLGDLVADISVLNLRANVVETEARRRRETCSFILESTIIGRENDKKEVISLLTQPHESVSSVAIVGIGGLGKTALAQMVYSDAEVLHFFEKRIWVCVSEHFDFKTILREMLGSLQEKKIDDGLSLDNLQRELRQILTGKRFLLVMDDTWNESHQKWAELKSFLMCADKDSKILVTARSKSVAQTMDVTVPYVLNALTSKKSWRLLKTIAFGDDTIEVDGNIELIGIKIAEKCRGVPLAIKTVAGLLHDRREEKEWIDVLDGECWKKCEDEDSIMPVLKLSYQNLSPQERQCFEYCALFPKDFTIDKAELIGMWMAQGYLGCPNEEPQHMEDVGSQLVKTFLKKSFFQDPQINQRGNVVEFKLHDLMHDLAMQVAGDDCCYLDSHSKRPVGRPMHVSLKSNDIGLLDSLDPSRLRSLIVLHADLAEHTCNKEFYEEQISVISNFRYLRVLVLKLTSSFMVRSGIIGKLKHLRYLDFSCCKHGDISKCISKLVCLQALILRPGTIELSKETFSRLINLRQVDIFSWNIGRGTRAVGSGKLCLGRPPYHGEIYSDWVSPLTNVAHISIAVVNHLRFLPPLERLPFLKRVSICQLYDLEYIHYREPLLAETFFPSLEFIHIGRCPNLRGWRRMGDDSSQSRHLSFPSFPCLSHLTIEKCQMLTHMPTFPNLDSVLTLLDFNVETLEATLNTTTQGSIHSPPLGMLRSLQISGANLNVKKLRMDWLQCLTSLEVLRIQCFSTQQFREIGFFSEYDPCCLQSLKTIVFHDCEDLEALPNLICNLSSLQHIKLSNCSNLASLPELSRLTKLHTLEIIGCPLLVEECRSRTETSATWPIIAHIPNIILK